MAQNKDHGAASQTLPTEVNIRLCRRPVHVKMCLIYEMGIFSLTKPKKIQI